MSSPAGSSRSVPPPQRWTVLGIRWLDGWWGAGCGFLLLAGLAIALGIQSPRVVMMEGIVADVARGMVSSGDPLIPRLYGEVYTYKPPLVYWLTALAFSVGGEAVWVLRLPSGLLSLAMGMTVLGLVGRITRPAIGFLAAVASLGGFLFLQKLALAEFDTALAATVGISVVTAATNLARGRKTASAGWWVACYLSLAAAFLTKGIPALMAFLPGLLAAAWVTGELDQLRSRGHLMGCALFLLVVGSYLWLAWQVVGPVILEQPLAEAQGRGLSWTWGAAGQTLAKPVLVLALFLPWSLVWPDGLPRAAASEPDSPARRLHLAAWAFLILGILAFMAVPTLENRYFLPLAAPAAIVSALTLERLRKTPRRTVRLAKGATGLVAAGAVGLALASPVATVLGRASLVLLGGGTLIWLIRSARDRRPATLATLLLATSICGWTAEATALRPYRDRSRDFRAVARQVHSTVPPGTTIWTLGEPDLVGIHGSLYYYVEGPIRTFLPRQRLPASATVLLTEVEEERLEQTDPEGYARLDPLLEIEHPQTTLRLFRERGPAERTPSPPAAAAR